MKNYPAIKKRSLTERFFHGGKRPAHGLGSPYAGWQMLPNLDFYLYLLYNQRVSGGH